MLSTDRLISLVCILFLLFPLSVAAQDDLDCSKPENLEECLAFKVTFDLFCNKDEDASFELGIDPDSFDISLTAFFDSAPKQKSFKLYFADGDIAPGEGKQVKISKLSCNGTSCRTTITPEYAQSLEDSFDFDQTFINVVLRTGVKDYCIGKFTNNETTVAENARKNRYFCSLTAANDSGLEGEGFFDPGALSSNGRLHFKFAGAEAGSTINACRLVGNKYRSVFKAKAISEGETDSDVYRTLTTEQQQQLSEWPDLYSYDFSASTSRALTKSLSSIFNSSFSSTNAKSTLKNATKERRKRKRKKRKKNSRALVVQDLSSPLLRKKSARQTFEDWLSFDPNYDVLYVAPNCKGDVPSKSLGTISCSSGAPGKSCASLTGSSEGVEGTVCKEQRDGYNVLTVRASGLATGTYRLCVDGTLEADNSLVVAQDESSTFGELELVDDTTVAAAVERFESTSVDIPNATSFGLSAGGNCSELELSGTF